MQTGNRLPYPIIFRTTHFQYIYLRDTDCHKMTLVTIFLLFQLSNRLVVYARESQTDELTN